MTDWTRFSNPLVTSTDSRKSEKLIRSVAHAKFGRRVDDVIYEHGQWWVLVRGLKGEHEHVYSAVDDVHGFDGRGIDFESVG